MNSKSSGNLAMAKKAAALNPTDTLFYDSLIDGVCSDLRLPPTNLQRGGLLKDAVSTGALAADLILGGGWPPGMISVPFGFEQSGKSTLAYFANLAAVENKIHTMFFDWEGSTDADRIERMGLKIDWTKEAEAGQPVYFRYFNTMRHGEQMFRTMKRILDKMPDRFEGPPQMLFFLDSVPAVVPQATDEDDEGKVAARRAAMYSDMLPLIKSRMAAKRCLLIMTNQTRENPRPKFGGKSEYEPGGNAVKFYSDVRLRMSKTVHPWGGKSYVHEELGWDGTGLDKYTFHKVKTVKNKAFSPNREAILRIHFEENGLPGRGIDPVWDVYEYLRLTGQVRRGRRKAKSATESCLIFDTGFHDDLLLWHEFKEIVANPANKGTKLDFRQKAREEILSGDAFNKYYENLSGVAVEAEPESSDEDEADLEDEAVMNLD